MDTHNLSGLGFALCLYNTKTKLVVKGVQYMKKIFLIILSIFVAIIIVVDVSLFISGSLETFPTTEQIEKGRIVYGSLLVFLIIVETFILTRILKRK